MTDAPIPSHAILVATDAWRSAFPGAVVGALVMRDVRNPEESPALEAAKRRLEEELRAAGDPGAHPTLRAYADYYRAHGKTYHVKAQRESVALKQGDMLIADGAGIISSVLRGPDQRSRITRQTHGVLFAVYAPAGIGEASVRRHLDDIRANVELLVPDAQTEALVTVAAP